MFESLKIHVQINGHADPDASGVSASVRTERHPELDSGSLN